MKEEKLVARGAKYRFNKVNLQYNFFAPFKCKMPRTTFDALMKENRVTGLVSFFFRLISRLRHGSRFKSAFFVNRFNAGWSLHRLLISSLNKFFVFSEGKRENRKANERLQCTYCPIS